MLLTIAIVLNWRDAPSTVACVDSLLALHGDLGVIVVDNDSGDGSLETIRNHCHQQAPAHDYRLIDADAIGQERGGGWVAVLSSGRNGGYAFGNNVGIRLALSVASCRYVWVLNADILIPDPATLDRLVAKMEASPDVGICGAKIVYADDPMRVQTLGGGVIDRYGRSGQFGQGQRADVPVDEHEVERQLNYINGACSFVRRSFIEQVGLMREDYFLYFEEIDWYTRGKQHFALGFCASAVLQHHVGKSIGTADSGGRSALSTYYMTASRIRFCRHFHPGSVPVVIGETLMEVLRRLREGRIRLALASLCATLQTGPGLARRLRIF